MDPRAHEHLDSVRLTLISLLIAFALTLVFRGFVIEAFIIPTGSMAPTLLGDHWRVQSPVSGHDWAINSRVSPRAPGEGLDASDPITRAPLTLLKARKSAGDRILVLKWAYALRDPDRWDTVVFKYPERPRENFIKRLVGLPGEDVWLVDGDVFVRQATQRRSDAATKGSSANEPRAQATGLSTSEPRAASDSDWRIVRKPDRVQRALWQPVWNSESAWAEGILAGASAPDSPTDPGAGAAALTPPWTGEDWWWTNDGRALRHEGEGRASIEWDATRWPITDWTPYNDTDAPTWRDERRYFPVSDIRVRFAVEPAALRSLQVTVRARGKQFVARIQNPDPSDPDRVGFCVVGALNSPGPEGESLSTSRAPHIRTPIPVGSVTDVEFWLFDQRLQLWLDGKRVAAVDYDWTPTQRLALTTGRSDPDVAVLLGEDPDTPPPRGNPLADPALYSPPQISISFDGGPITLHRLAVDRDIFYRPAVMENDPRRPARATHPSNLAHLSPDEFFVLGDNSGASKDGRLWDAVDPWVAREIDPEPGVVHRAMLLGEAFFVYFPAAHEVSIAGERRPLIPDFGRMRFIR